MRNKMTYYPQYTVYNNSERIQFLQRQPPGRIFTIHNENNCNEKRYMVSDDGWVGFRIHNIRKCQPNCMCKL